MTNFGPDCSSHASSEADVSQGMAINSTPDTQQSQSCPGPECSHHLPGSFNAEQSHNQEYAAFSQHQGCEDSPGCEASCQQLQQQGQQQQQHEEERESLVQHTSVTDDRASSSSESDDWETGNLAPLPTPKLQPAQLAQNSFSSPSAISKQNHSGQSAPGRDEMLPSACDEFVTSYSPCPARASQPQQQQSTSSSSHRWDSQAETDSSPFSPESVSHVVEAYDLTIEVKTLDLEIFLEYMTKEAGLKLQPVIRWVDDSHALFVCSSGTEAKLLLAHPQKFFTMRTMDQACPASQAQPSIELLPPKPRPKTTAVVAKQLLSRHLGMLGIRDKGGESALAASRLAAKEGRKLRQQQREEVWNE